MPRPLAAIRRQAHLRRNKDESIASVENRKLSTFRQHSPYRCAVKTRIISLQTLPNSRLCIVAPDCYRADRVFGQIIREFQLPIIQKAPQLTPAAQGVIACFAQCAARERRGPGRFNPLLETFNDRLSFFPPQTQPFCGP
jgi:hypothetical protein